MKTLQSSEPQLAVALLLEGVCLVAGFRVLLGSAVEEVTSPAGGPLRGLKVDIPAHSPQDPDPSSLIHAATGLTQKHHTALHTAPVQGVCAALGCQNWAQTHRPFSTSSPS